MSATPSENAASAMPVSLAGEASPVVEPTPAPAFPPYPPYKTEPAPPSVANTIIAGRDIRIQHKSIPKQPVRPAPKPAKPRGPKATDVVLSRRATRAHARCLRRHGAVLTDRLERIAKPMRRKIINLWRDHAYDLAPETIYRLRSMLDADEPFKPDQAYEYFVNLRKTKKKTAAKIGVNQIKKDLLAICSDKKFIWARNATVAFARGIQMRLTRPGHYVLADEMLRLSNIVLDDMCKYIHIKTPSRRCRHPKAKFMMEMADKITVWIDDVLAESEDRMLMMDFDEDDEVEKSKAEVDIPPSESGASVTPRGSASGMSGSSAATPAATPRPSPAATPGGTPGVTPPTTTPTRTPPQSKSESNLCKSLVLQAEQGGFTDNFLDMMGGGAGGGGGPGSKGLLEPRPAYMKFKGPMLEAFLILTDSMTDKGDEQLLSHGKFQQTYKEGATELKETTDFDAKDYDCVLADRLNKDLAATAQPNTPPHLAPSMKEIVGICSNYLAQNAEFNKDKGPAFKLLIKTMKTKPKEQLYKNEKASRTYGSAANELEKAKGLESDHDDPNLSQEIHSLLSKLVAPVTPKELNSDMKETLDVSSKYLSQSAVDEIERGPAFDILIKELEKDGSGPFTPQFDLVNTKHAAAYTLKSAPGLSGVTPDPKTAPIFKQTLQHIGSLVAPPHLKADMEGVVDRCSNYLSAFVRDRGRAMELLMKTMKGKGKQELTKRNDYKMDYATGAQETENAPTIVPFLPVKDVAIEVRDKLANDVEKSTPVNLKTAMKTLVQDVGRHLSQVVALKSGIAGERYALNFLTAIKQSLGLRPLYKTKTFGQTYGDAAEELKYAGVLESDHGNEELHQQIKTEMKQGVPTKLTTTVTQAMDPIMNDASKHLAKVGSEKGKAMDYVVKLMKEEGDAPLEKLQGYMQTYNDGARRIENATSLANDKVEKASYESVKTKLTTITDKKPDPTHEKHLPGLIEDSAKFLAAPFAENNADKRRVLADLMGRKGDEVLGQDGTYKMTYKEGGAEIMNAPVGVTTASDEKKKADMLGNINEVIPNENLKQTLKDPAHESAAYLSDVIKDRGEAMRHDGGSSGRKSHAAQLSSDEEARRKAEEEKRRRAEEEERRRAEEEERKRAEQGQDKDSSGRKSHAGQLSADEEARRKEEERRRAEEDERKRVEEASRRAEEEEAERRRKAGGGSGGRMGMHKEDVVEGGAKDGKKAGAGAGAGAETDPEREAALAILHSELKSRGGENFYKQPSTQISHSQASDWLKKPPMKVDKSIKKCADTDRLHKKFERKLSEVVAKKTPSHMGDVMQDVVIESSRMLSEYFVASNYKALARVGLISEMQKRGNEILVETNGAAETFFFAAQRLKKATTTEAKVPRASVAYYITKKLDDMIRCRSMARKLTSTMKDHIKGTADYLSELATTPDEEIAAYVALLGEMEANGDALLIEGDIPKSFKDAAAYLRQLTTSKDEINMSNCSLKCNTKSKLKEIMANVPPAGYTSSVLNGVISKNAKLLVSYIMLQGEKTKVLKVLVEKMDAVGDNVLLRHGTLRKTFIDGADLLRDKNNDQLRVPNGDPVVARKIQIKLNTLMAGQTPEKIAALMDDVIEDATNYLAVHLLQPQFIQVCKCMKNVFVQCELWCDEILRRVTQPCCSCTHNVLPQALLDLAPGEQIRISPSYSRAFAPGTEISLKTCPTKMPRTCIRRGEKPPECAMRRTDGCKNERTTSYLLYTTMYDQQPSYSRNPSDMTSSLRAQRCTESKNLTSFQSLLLDIYKSSEHSANDTYKNKDESEPEHESQETSNESTEMYFTPPSTSSEASSKPSPPFCWSPRTKYSEVVSLKKGPCFRSVLETTTPSFSSRTPIVTTDQMGDWHAMMVSLVWNVQAWRDWIQDCVDRALSYKYDPNILPMESEERWAKLRTRITNEALQWRQYNSFSRQLTLRLASRYENKHIVSPTRSTVKTALYTECQSEMIDIIDMFYRWTHWLIAVVKETDMLQQVTGSDVPLHLTRWIYFKRQVEKYAEDWKKYKTHLSVFWEQKYRKVISEWLPSWNQPCPVWVVSACGAVPSGAVAAGLSDGEVTWVARTTHKKQVMPAALYPSKHCCLVYAEGSIYHYTKYQVMCNADVKWKPWKAGNVPSEAVKVARGVYAGRVHYRDTHLLGAVRPPFYRCHVVIFNRPFAFNCYDLLVLDNGNR